MADDTKEDTSVLEGLLSTSDHLESLESLDPAFTTNTGSFRQRHVSDSVSLASFFHFRYKSKLYIWVTKTKLQKTRLVTMIWLLKLATIWRAPYRHFSQSKTLTSCMRWELGQKSLQFVWCGHIFVPCLQPCHSRSVRNSKQSHEGLNNVILTGDFVQSWKLNNSNRILKLKFRVTAKIFSEFI